MIEIKEIMYWCYYECKCHASWDVDTLSLKSVKCPSCGKRVKVASYRVLYVEYENIDKPMFNSKEEYNNCIQHNHAEYNL